MQLPKAMIGATSHVQHNHYSPEKFWSRQPQGRLVDPYQQRTMLVTEDFIVGYQLALEDEVGEAAGEIMYRCGYEWGRADIASFEKRFAAEFGRSMAESHAGMALETWWWPLQAAGWGSWSYDMTQIKDGLIFVDLFESVVAKTIGPVGKVVCHYYAGFFAAVFGHIAGTELSGLEIQCYAMGETFCKFLIGASKRINAAQFWAREGATAKEILTRL